MTQVATELWNGFGLDLHAHSLIPARRGLPVDSHGEINSYSGVDFWCEFLHNLVRPGAGTASVGRLQCRQVI